LGGGVASILSSWQADVPPEIAIYPIQLPGRESRLREPLFTQLAPIIRTLTHSIRPYLDRPFALFGHSLGALISFELARSLRRQYRRSPMQLFVSGCSAPQIPRSDPPIHDLPEPAFLEELRRLQGTAEEVLRHPELLQLILPVLRADFALRDSYIYAPDAPLDCPIAAFGGLEDHEVPQEDLDAWRHQTWNSFTLRMMPGDHFFVHSARPALTQALTQELLLQRLPSQ